MVLLFENILRPQTLAVLDKWFAKATYEQGANTAFWGAKAIKTNQQISRQAHPDLVKLDELVLSDLYSNEGFVRAVFAKAVAPFLYAKSVKDQGYGWHVDNAFMGHADSGGVMRSDISCSVAVNDASAYKGGDLMIGDECYRLKRGSAIIYPSYSLHQVTKVTKGERQVCVTWIQSLIKDASYRQILFDLDVCRKRAFERESQGKDFSLLNQSYMNLMRIWGEL